MNKKGFTLVEVLAVIMILAILSIIVVVNVVGIKKDEDKENNKNVISAILAGAKRYAADNPNLIDEVTSDAPASISVQTLIENNYVEFDETQNNFKNDNVQILACPDNLRLIYSFEGYNDCGCENQASDGNDTLCKEQN